VKLRDARQILFVNRTVGVYIDTLVTSVSRQVCSSHGETKLFLRCSIAPLIITLFLR
jgi:hypothetical protein